MFKTFVGPVEDSGSVVYLRPETAQGILLTSQMFKDRHVKKFLLELHKSAKHLEMKSIQKISYSEHENLNKWKCNSL